MNRLETLVSMKVLVTLQLILAQFLQCGLFFFNELQLIKLIKLIFFNQIFAPGSAFIILYYLLGFSFKLFCLSSQETEILACD